jgi:hypothetical protein
LYWQIGETGARLSLTTLDELTEGEKTPAGSVKLRQGQGPRQRFSKDARRRAITGQVEPSQVIKRLLKRHLFRIMGKLFVDITRLVEKKRWRKFR